MIRSHAPGFVPKNIRAETRRRPCRSELTRDPEPLRCHGSPASWLLPRGINTALRYYPSGIGRTRDSEPSRCHGSPASWLLPKRINTELRYHPSGIGRTRDSEPLRFHGSPASWLLPKRNNTELRHHPRRGEIDREPAALRSCKIPARRWGFQSSSGYPIETHHLTASVGASLLAIRNHCVVTDRQQGTERPFGSYESKTTVIFAGLTGATLLANRQQLCAYQKLRPGAGDRAATKCDGGEL